MKITITNNGLFTQITKWVTKTTGLAQMKVTLIWAALYFTVSIAAMVGVATRFDVSFWLVLFVCALGFCTVSFNSGTGDEKEWAIIPKPYRIYVEYILWTIGGIHYLEQDSMTWLGVPIIVWLGMNVVDKIFFNEIPPETLS